MSMKTKKKLFIIPAAVLTVCVLLFSGIFVYLQICSWGFARRVPLVEQLCRMDMVRAAESWLDTKEGSDRHGQIVELYNSHKPLAQGYPVTMDDNWCDAFASAIAIAQKHTDIIPTECGCERQIGLWQKLGRWEENDNYMPLPGDYIYYAWDERFSIGDCTGWADHVGIVVGTSGPFIKVIEGNRNDMVTYRVILRGNWQIRGYGLPDYASK